MDINEFYARARSGFYDRFQDTRFYRWAECKNAPAVLAGAFSLQMIVLLSFAKAKEHQSGADSDESPRLRHRLRNDIGDQEVCVIRKFAYVEAA